MCSTAWRKTARSPTGRRSGSWFLWVSFLIIQLKIVLVAGLFIESWSLLSGMRSLKFLFLRHSVATRPSFNIKLTILKLKTIFLISDDEGKLQNSVPQPVPAPTVQHTSSKSSSKSKNVAAVAGEEGAAAGGGSSRSGRDGIKSQEEKRRHIKSIIDKIPTEKADLFNYPLDWNEIDSTIEKKIRPWINKKIIEYIGEPEPTLVDFICSKVLAGSTPQGILDDVQMVSRWGWDYSTQEQSTIVFQRFE